jgi:hypothetical protein
MIDEAGRLTHQPPALQAQPTCAILRRPCAESPEYALPSEQLAEKLKPSRFPNMSAQMAAIVGYLLGEPFSEPAIAELHITADGGVLAVPVTADGIRGSAAFIAAEADLRANLSHLGMAAGLDQGEWADYVGLVRARTGLELADTEQVDLS